jgi:hypothetical protein
MLRLMFRAFLRCLRNDLELTWQGPDPLPRSVSLHSCFLAVPVLATAIFVWEKLLFVGSVHLICTAHAGRILVAISASRGRSLGDDAKPPATQVGCRVALAPKGMVGGCWCQVAPRFPLRGGTGAKGPAPRKGGQRGLALAGGFPREGVPSLVHTCLLQGTWVHTI